MKLTAPARLDEILANFRALIGADEMLSDWCTCANKAMRYPSSRVLLLADC